MSPPQRTAHDADTAPMVDVASYPSEIVILVRGGLVLAVSRRTRWDACWHWRGWRYRPTWGRC